MRFGSLFAGIGGIDLGLERAGMQCIWQVEKDEYCLKVLEKHWPDVPRYKDVRDVGRNLEPVDLIAGGFPCQPHSVAGKRKGAEDDRNLWPEFIRIIRETKPRYVLAENVPGIITTYLDTVLSDLESEDYTCWTFNIPACAFDAPHKRERIFIVACNKFGRNRTRERIAARTENKGRRSPEEREKIICSRKEISLSGDTISSSTSMADSSIERERRLPIRQGRSLKATCDIERSREDVSNAKEVHAQRHSQEQGQEQLRGSDWWTVEPDVGRVAHGIPSRVDRLRALGNAVVPQVAEWIGRRIMEYERLLS